MAAIGWAALAVFMAGLGQLYFSLRLPRLDGFIFYGIAAVAFWRFLRYAPTPPALPLAEQGTQPAANRVPAGVCGTLAIVLSGLAVFALRDPTLLLPPQALTVGAALAWIATGVALEGGRATVRGLRGWARSLSRQDALLLAGILGVAAALRLVALPVLPFGLWYDEADIGLEAQHILSDPSYRPVYAQSTTSPAVFVYLVAAAEAVFSHTVFAVRLVPALSGILSTLLAYLLARALFGPRAGLLAAALYAVARWDVNFSRIGMQGATTPLLLMTVTGLAAAALGSGRYALYAAFGVALGTLFWFYSANYMFPLVLTLSAAALVLKQGSLAWGHRGGLVLAAVGALLVAAPVIGFAVTQPGEFFGRAHTASLFRDKSLAESALVALGTLGEHLTMLHIEGDRNGRHNLPGAPMLDGITAAAMFLGVTAAVRSWRDPRSVLFLAWLCVMLLPGVLSLEFESPQGLRSIGVVPAAVLLATLGIERLLAWVSPYVQEQQLLKAGGAVAGLALVLNAGTYFGLQADNFAVWNEFSTPETLIAKRLDEGARQGERGLVSVFYTTHPTIRFLTDVRPAVFSPIEHAPLQEAIPTTIYMHHLERSTFEWLRLLYPDAACQAIRQGSNQWTVYYQCTIGPGVIKATQGLLASYARPPAVRQEVAPLAVVPPSADPSEIVEVAGSLFVPQTGKYQFQIEGSPSAVLFLDGVRRAPPDVRPDEVELGLGLHEIRLSSPGSPSPTRLLWRPPGGDLGDIPGVFLFHGNVRPMGLTASYSPGASSEGTPALMAVEPSPSQYYQLPPLTIPFNAVWTGSIFAPVAGTYLLDASAVSTTRIEISGAPVVATHGPNQREQGSVNLTAGWHPIRITYVAAHPYAQMGLNWTRPDGVHEEVPPNRFRPW